MGDELYAPRDSNPKGFFEDPEINGINEKIISLIDYRVQPFLKKIFHKRNFNESAALTEGHRWLARLPLGTLIPANNEIRARIQKATQRTPYCFKDPRFSYTLEVWRPLLFNTVFLCVFRDPASTAKSIMKECIDVAHLHNEKMSFEIALEIWRLMYLHILRKQRREGQWLFIHFNQVLTEEGLDRIGKFTGAPVDKSFPDPSLRRSYSNQAVPEKFEKIYQQLSKLAEYED